MQFISKNNLSNRDSDSSLVRGFISISLGVIIGLSTGFAVKTAQTGFLWFDHVSGAEVERIDNAAFSPHDPAILNARKVEEQPADAQSIFLADASATAFVPHMAPDGTLLNFDESDPETADDTTLYTVRAGDTLSDIANLFGVSVKTIQRANGLSSKTVKPGTELSIPPLDGVPYTVRKGDTILGIAKKFKVDAENIADYNYIFDTSNLKAGTKIFIPNGDDLPTVVKPSSNNSSSRPASITGFIHPVPGARVSRGYFIDRGGRGVHKGIDWAAPTGTPIRASASGTIKRASYGWNGAYGNMVVINHGSRTETLYAHMTKLNVKRGQYVNQGDIIGWVGSTGRSTGPHLHFEVIKSGNRQAIKANQFAQ